MIGIQTIWTRPYFQRRKLGSKKIDGVYRLSDFEFLTLFASAVTYKKHCGPIYCYTDSPGVRFLERTGLLGVYDKVLTDLDHAKGVDPLRFWAYGKVLALERAPTPCCSIDMDAVLWKPMETEIKTDVIASHTDHLSWDCYSANKETYSRFGMSSPLWDWNALPINVSALAFTNEKVKNFYTTVSSMFMETYSKFSDPDMVKRSADDLRARGHNVRLFEMIFAEQRLLGMCIARAEASVQYLTKIDPETDHIMENSHLTHLWGVKDFYKGYSPAKDSVVTWLINYIATSFPEHANLMTKVQEIYRRNADSVIEGEAAFGDFKVVSPTSNLLKSNYRMSVLSQVKGDVRVKDINFPAERKAEDGSLVLRGETVKVYDGSCKIDHEGILHPLGEGQNFRAVRTKIK